MKWTDLQPQVRATILVALFVVAVVLLWVFFADPMRARLAGANAGIVAAESELEQIERQREQLERQFPGTSQDSAAERGEWLDSRDELLGRLGPESELPLLIESIVRLADAQGLEVFVTSEQIALVSGDEAAQGATVGTDRVIGRVPGAQVVPLNCRILGDYAATSRFISQVGQLGWVIEVDGLHMARSFPEVVTDLRLLIFFRPSTTGNGSDSGQVPGAGPGGSSVGARGGRGNG